VRGIVPIRDDTDNEIDERAHYGLGYFINNDLVVYAKYVHEDIITHNHEGKQNHQHLYFLFFLFPFNYVSMIHKTVVQLTNIMSHKLTSRELRIFNYSYKSTCPPNSKRGGGGCT